MTVFCLPAIAQVPPRTQTPAGGVVTAGQASISKSGNVTTINQSSNRASIKWNSFDIGKDASINFVQPDNKSATLNRVDSMAPSQIYGQIRANGQVYLMNPAGVYFAPSASVNVGGIVATTHQMSDEDFMQGKTTFKGRGAKGSVVNEGKIETDLGGYVALLAPEVRNKGFILARQGTVAIAGGDSITLNFGPLNKLESVTVTAGDMAVLVENQQAVQAPGGLVIMSARAIHQLASRVVNTGVIEAQGLSDIGGRIILDAGSSGKAVVAGVLDTSSQQGRGGRVDVTGQQIQVRQGARINASGSTGGGEVFIGGGWQGKDPSLLQATNTSIETETVIQANATKQGSGGTVVAWSNIKNTQSTTVAKGVIEAKGGLSGGDGGKIETSGANVDISGAKISAEAPAGRGGMWLIDPYDYVIGPSQATTIMNSLNSGTSVIVETSVNNSSFGSNGNASSLGNITVSSSITKTNGDAASLTFNAANEIYISADITAVGNGLDLVLNALGRSSLVTGRLSLGSGSLTKLGSGALTLTQNNTYSGQTNISAGSLIIENDAPSFNTRGFSGMNGSLTIQPASASFSSSYTVPSLLTSASLGGLTIGKPSNNAALTFSNNILVAGPINIYGGAINFNANLTSSLGDIQVLSSGVASIASGKSLSASNGNIVITASRFVNNSNSSALSVSGSSNSWQVWSTNSSPFSGVSEDITGNLPFDFVQYNAIFGTTTVLGRGNGFLYSLAPTISVGLVGNSVKVYDGNRTASLTDANYSITRGGVNGDVITQVRNPTSGTYASADAGNGIFIIADGPSVLSAYTSTSSGSKPAYGYRLSGGAASGNIGTISPANLTVSTNDLAQPFTGQAFFGGNGISVSGLVNGETTSVLTGTLVYTGTSQGAINPGQYGLLASGLINPNYKIGYVGGTLAIAPPVFGIASPAPSSVLTAMIPSPSTLVMPTPSNSADANDAASDANAGSDDGQFLDTTASTPLSSPSVKNNEVVLTTGKSSGSGAKVGGKANTTAGTGQGAGGPGDGAGPGQGAGQGIGGGGTKTDSISQTSSGSGANNKGEANTQPGTGQGAGGPGDGAGPGQGAGQGIGQGGAKGPDLIPTPPPGGVLPPGGVTPPSSVVPPSAVTPPPGGVLPPGGVTPPSSVVPPSAVTPPPGGVLPPGGVTPPSSVTPPIAVTPPPGGVLPPGGVTPPSSVVPPIAVTPPPSGAIPTSPIGQRLVTYEDISVSLVREPRPQANGLVTVLVPEEIIKTGKEFSFKLPEKIGESAASTQSIRVTSENGGPLPSWLNFDPNSKTLESMSSSNRVFPIKLIIRVNNQAADLIISERTK